MKGGALLDLIFKNKEELLGRHMKAVSSCVCSDHEIVELRILRGGNKTNCRITTMDISSSLFRDLPGKLLRDGPGEKRGQGELVDFQRSPFPSSRMFHPHGYRKLSIGSLHG